jgi:hypothetical protein
MKAGVDGRSVGVVPGPDKDARKSAAAGAGAEDGLGTLPAARAQGIRAKRASRRRRAARVFMASGSLFRVGAPAGGPGASKR